MARIATVGLLGLLLVVTPAWGQSVILQPGEPAPSEGVFFPKGTVTALVEALRDRETWQAQIEALKSQVVALEQALAEKGEALKAKQEALEAMKLAVAKAEWIDQNWNRVMERYEAIITKLEAHEERLAKRIESLERQRNWALFAGPIGLLLSLIIAAL